MKITVIIPVYNSEKNISRCLESIINQTYCNWEVVVVDDGSEDNSLKILQQYEKNDNRIKVISQKNEGAGSARNKGLDNLKSEGYVVFIDSDDYIESNYFELLSKHHEDIVFIDVVQKDTHGKLIKKEKISLYDKEKKETILRKQMTGYIPWGGVRKAIKSKIITSKKIRYSTYTIGEEAVFSFKILFYSSTIGFIKSNVYNYMIRSDSLSNTKIDDPWNKVAEHMEKSTKELNVYEKYANTLNSFYITACVVSIRRIISYYSYKEFMNKSKKRFYLLRKQINNNYGIDRKSMSFKTKIIYLLLCLNFRRTIYLLGKLYR